MADSGDRIVLDIPRGNLALAAMRVVIGWTASCHDRPLDRLDDVQLAVETILGEEASEGGAFSLTLSVEDRILDILLEGMENAVLRGAIETSPSFTPSAGCPLDVGLILTALVDEYEVMPSDGRVFGVHMRKRIA